MGVQQTSLDFFNLPPDKGKSDGEGEVSKVQEVQKVSEVSGVGEVEKVGEVLEIEGVGMLEVDERVDEVEGVDEIERIEETAEIKNAEEYEQDLRREEVLGDVDEPLIVVDETVRELDFVVKEIKAPVLKTGKKSTRGRMKLSEMDILVDLVEVPEDEVLFQKRYYNIGAVSDMFKVNISLIRFWENEFDVLKPKKNGKGDRLFRPEDIKNLQLIYHLLREKKYTIEGAKDFLKKNKKADDGFALIDSLKKIKSFLLELKSNL
jgi:DNA-binding transcriptional MerR regulator